MNAASEAGEAGVLPDHTPARVPAVQYTGAAESCLFFALRLTAHAGQPWSSCEAQGRGGGELEQSNGHVRGLRRARGAHKAYRTHTLKGERMQIWVSTSKHLLTRIEQEWETI